MPDKVRSVDDMVADMEKAVEEPEGNVNTRYETTIKTQPIKALLQLDTTYKTILQRIVDKAKRNMRDVKQNLFFWARAPCRSWARPPPARGPAACTQRIVHSRSGSFPPAFLWVHQRLRVGIPHQCHLRGAA